MATILGLLRVIEERENALKAMADGNRRFAEAAIKLRWPPPWHLPVTAIDRIVSAYESGQLSADETAAVFASYYTPNRVIEFGREWAQYPWLSGRLAILQEGLANHAGGRYYSAVCVMLPQIEGVLRDALGKKPTEKDLVAVLRSSRLGTVARDFYAKVIMEPFDPGGRSPIPDLSRHAILHGKATDYGTSQHSLKVILITDIIVTSIEESRRAAPRPSAHKGSTSASSHKRSIK